MLADWLQGTNMYTLYQSYGVDVGMLFLTGFSSSAVFGTFLGLFVDRFGRRNGCIVFCLLEVCDRAIARVCVWRIETANCRAGAAGDAAAAAGGASDAALSGAASRRGRLLYAGYPSIAYKRACSGPGFSIPGGGLATERSKQS